MSDNENIHMRLMKLPHRVALPLRDLLEAGHLEPDDASLILDAGDCAGEHHRLLGFAVGYLHLRGQGVPVHDVIRMAKAQERRINLGWSAKRWKAEHDRLSRAQALHRLAAENVRYDVAKFEALLPERFPGYLIRTSRRLGMEGLRQRHCVAAYHPQLLAGSCAIAVVFVDRKRWTVQLGLTGDADRPLRIAQIKTRLNGTAGPAIETQIHALLGIARDLRVPPALPEDGRGYLDTLRRLLPVLRAHQLERVTVSFDGCGDSGSIQDIDYNAAVPFDARALTLDIETATPQFDDGRWVHTTERRAMTVNEAIEELTYEYLDETDVDWYNNDGGYGELVIDVPGGTVTLDINVRYTDATNEYYAETDIVSGEAV